MMYWSSKLDSLADHSTPEVSSIYEQDKLLMDLIAKEDVLNLQQMIDLLPDALNILTENQKYAIKCYCFDAIKKKQIATKLNVTPQMMTKYFKVGLKNLRKFY